MATYLVDRSGEWRDILLRFAHNQLKELRISILNFAEEAAGALAADKALEAVDPNAGFLATAAAVAGFKGLEMVKDHLAEGSPPATEVAA